MSDEATKLTPARFWILLLYVVLGALGFWVLISDLRGSSVAHVNNLNSAHMISRVCAIAWAVLLSRGVIESIKSFAGKQTTWPAPKWFLSFGILSVAWLYLFIGDLSLNELFFNKSGFWWLDPSAYSFNENLAAICKQMESPPVNCSAEWFASSDIRNRLLVPEYNRAISRLVALAPALAILVFPWLCTYRKAEQSEEKRAA